MSWITEAIQDFRDGKKTLPQLTEQLATAKYPDPPDQKLGTYEAYAANESGDGMLHEGTWEEVKAARATGLLTNDEYNVIAKAAYADANK